MKTIDAQLFGPKTDVIKTKDKDDNEVQIISYSVDGAAKGPGSLIVNDGKAHENLDGEGEMLSRMDQVIEALSDQEAFADALQSGGVFYHDSDSDDKNDFTQVEADDPPVDAPPADAIWNKATSRLLLVTDTTHFVRFGVWRKQFSDFATDSRVDENHPDWMKEGYYKTFGDEEGEPFAYSPLQPTSYESTSDAYPKGTARYHGTTVAVQNTIFLTGKVEATMNWKTDSVGGNLRVTIKDLTATDPDFGLLRY